MVRKVIVFCLLHVQLQVVGSLMVLFFAPASDKQKKNVRILGKLFVNQYYPVTLESFPWATERFEEGGIVYRRIPSLGILRGAALSFQVVGGGGGGNFIIIVFLGWKI